MHITRNQQEKCVMVRIMRQAEMHQKNFTLKQYGTWEAAEAAGKKWRDQQLQVLPPTIRNEKDRMTSRNHSGKVGVYLGRHLLRKKNGREYEYWRWIARWPGCPYSGGLSWSIQTLGDDDAFALAVLSRNMETINRSKVLGQLERIYGTKQHHSIMSLKSQSI
ncbi:MAG: hypothetical protein ACTHKU_10985 [Verrucomicrobiota bacterium]